MHVLKSAVALLLAWGATTLWLPGQPQYLSMASSLLMVNSTTVFRSVSRALHSVLTRIAGTSLALATAWLLGSAMGTMVTVLAITLVTGGRRISDDRLQIASNAVLALAAAAAAPVGHVVFSALGTALGAGVGIAVNALILPPVHLAESDLAVHNLAQAMGGLLRGMGHDLDEQRHHERACSWLEQARDLERLVGDAQQHVRQGRESLRWNTRWSVRGHRRHDTDSELWHTLHRVSFQIRGIARTLVDSVGDEVGHHLGPLFLERYAELLKLAGQAVEEFSAAHRSCAAPDCEALSARSDARDRLRDALDHAEAWHETMTDLVGHGTLAQPDAWHVYGSLMTDLERLLFDLDRTDAAHPVAATAGR
ncbi:aromatic acid exporter family protein [Peterkaempfera griseoplana]|uniref:hypothetical protein n=1 Tax=Peterkaempfera griseoplana TaxID=66896 RepID=UPI0006E34A1C|nr:hypothetical protein [Peterkaempfera griseoplana]